MNGVNDPVVPAGLRESRSIAGVVIAELEAQGIHERSLARIAEQVARSRPESV